VTARAIRVLAVNTFREAVRDRVLYSMVFFAGAVLVLSLFASKVTVGDHEKVVRSVGQGAMDLFGCLIAMFLGVSLVWKELERRTVYTILARPLPRWSFIVGKYAGLMLTLAVEVALLLALYTVLMAVQQHVPPPVVFVSAASLLAKLALLTAWATLFSTTSSPVTAAAFTLSVFAIGNLADDIWLFGRQAESEAVQAAARALYWALPNFEIFNLRAHAVHERAIPWERFFTAIAYSAAYSSAVLGLAVVSFEKKDFK
jgi:ABC-type transport system involved in multi-copper enzyme maturation permease subunit